MSSLDLSEIAGGIRIDSPVVVVEGGDVSRLVTQASISNSALRFVRDRCPMLIYLSPQVPNYSVAPDGSTLTAMGNNGENYTVRRVTEDDGVWASHKFVPAPVDSLEQLVLGGPYMSPGVYSTTDENLWAALGPDDEEVKELVYSSPSGIYVRSNNTWFKVPDEDTSLDGLESIDVNAEFLPVFDAAEAKGEPVPRTTVLQFEATAELPEESETLEPQEIAAAEDAGVS